VYRHIRFLYVVIVRPEPERDVRLEFLKMTCFRDSAVKAKPNLMPKHCALRVHSIDDLGQVALRACRGARRIHPFFKVEGLVEIGWKQ
jgi:hypothetical protein